MSWNRAVQRLPAARKTKSRCASTQRTKMSSLSCQPPRSTSIRFCPPLNSLRGKRARKSSSPKVENTTLSTHLDSKLKNSRLKTSQREKRRVRARWLSSATQIGILTVVCSFAPTRRKYSTLRPKTRALEPLLTSTQSQLALSWPLNTSSWQMIKAKCNGSRLNLLMRMQTRKKKTNFWFWSNKLTSSTTLSANCPRSHAPHPTSSTTLVLILKWSLARRRAFCALYPLPPRRSTTTRMSRSMRLSTKLSP